MKLQSMTLAAAVGVAGLVFVSTAFGASHREAPLIAQDPTADITDVYAFISYDEANLNRAPADQRVTLIMNVVPGQDPADGPNYFNFADDVLYRLHIDNNANGRAENLVYEFRFSTETRPALGSLTGPIPLIGNPNIGNAALQGISKLDGAGSEGITRRQTYTVTEVRDNKRTPLFKGQKLVAVPSNVGPFTIPNYEDLASQGVYEDGNVRVFAGQRAETFYIDLGAVFDTVNLRRPVPALTQAEDADDSVDPFGVNRFSGFNIHTIAIELPISRITSDRKAATATKTPIIGVYASTSRQSTRELQSKGRTKNSGQFVQVARMANPLVNELIINTPSKDFWNRTEPQRRSAVPGVLQEPDRGDGVESDIRTPCAGDAPHGSLASSTEVSGSSAEKRWYLWHALFGTAPARPDGRANRSRRSKPARCGARR